MAKQKKTSLQEITFNLRLLDIKIVQFSQFDLLSEFDKDAFPLVEYQTDFNFKVRPEEDRIVCGIVVTIRIIETGENFAEVKVESNYSVSPLNELAKLNNEKYDINKQLLYTIGSVTMSTVRGMLVERFKGSIIQNDIYPLVDLSKTFFAE